MEAIPFLQELLTEMRHTGLFLTPRPPKGPV